MDVALGILIFLGLLVALLWLLNRPEDDDLDEEEAAGLVAGTWPAARDVVLGEGEEPDEPR